MTCQAITYPLGSAPEFAVRLGDVSEGGVKLVGLGPQEEGTLLQVAIHLEGWRRYTAEFLKHGDDALSRPLTALGRVVRCERDGEGCFVLGVQFLDLWEDHWQAVRSFIDRECRGEKRGEW